MDRERVVIAEVLRTRGIRGEVVARSQTDIPGRFQPSQSLNAQLANGPSTPVEIAEAWQHKGDWVLKFSGVDSIEAAQRFRGAELWVPFSDRGSLAEGEFFESDLIDCQVLEAASGEPVGVVRGWQKFGEATPLMEVWANGRELLIPFVRSLCQVDLAARTIRIELPHGLLDL